jgi:hypothetical protein
MLILAANRGGRRTSTMKKPTKTKPTTRALAAAKSPAKTRALAAKPALNVDPATVAEMKAKLGARKLAEHNAKVAKKAAKTAETPPAKPKAEAAAPDTRTIKLLVDKNPRREGTGRHALFQILMGCDGATVATATERGATAAAIASAVRHGWIELVGQGGGE